MEIITRITARAAKTVYKDMFLAVYHSSRFNEVEIIGHVFTTPEEALDKVRPRLETGVATKIGYLSCRDYAKPSTRNNIVWG